MTIGLFRLIWSSGTSFSVRVPIITESYDLIIPERFFESPKVQVLLDTIGTKEFKARVLALGGYGVEKTGQVLN